MKTDVILLIVLAVCILLFLSNFGLGGVVGKAVSSFFFGLFGTPAYIFPILLFVAIAFFLTNRVNALVVRKGVGMIGLFVFACAFFQILMVGYEKGSKFRDFYTDSAYDHLGGGLVGGSLVKIFGTAFGAVGAVVIVVIALIIFAIILTQKPLLTMLKERSASAVTSAKEHRADRAQELAYRRQKKEAKRKEKSLSDDLFDEDYAGATADAEAPFEADEIIEDAFPEITPVSGGPELISSAAAEEPQERPVTGRRKKAAEAPAEEEPPKIIVEPAYIPDDIIVNPSAKPAASPENTGVESAAFAAPTMRPEAAVPAADPAADGAVLPSPEGADAGEKPNVTRAEAAEATREVSSEIAVKKSAPKPKRRYRFPKTDLLNDSGDDSTGDTNEQLKETAAKLQRTLHSFGVEATITHISRGPTVTRYELSPEQGVKVNKIVNLADDIKLNLAAADIRIEAPIPGKAAIGIEVPNRSNSSVVLKDLLDSRDFKAQSSKLSFAVGKDIGGKNVIADIAKMPHLLIAGATGSGKSVCINTMIMSLLYKSSPDDVKLILIDPKVVELSIYNGVPHLFIPVVTDPKKAAGALNWAVSEMTDRYQKFADVGARDLDSYNARIEQMDLPEGEERPEKMPRIVIIVDELADLMMVAKNEVEDAIVRLAQLARAAGMHLILATQRPSVDVITGLIKANMPSRIALSVTSGVDSRTILDMNGAEKLLGHGDMLFYPQGYTKPARIQGAFVSDEEITAVVDFLKETQEGHEYDMAIQEKIDKSTSGNGAAFGGDATADGMDEYFVEAGRLIIDKDKASIGMLQRAFRIGFNRAARIMDQLADAGVVGEEEGTKPRRILMDRIQFENYLEENG